MITIKKYSSTEQPIWDDFIDNSKNGTFMLKRGYMDYHSDRFIDNSLGSKFLEKKVEGYYTNDNLNYGPYKMLINCSENCFFTLNIAKGMVPRIVIKNALFSIGFLVIAYCGIKDNLVAIPILQILLSTLFITELIHHLNFIAKLEQLFERFKETFTKKNGCKPDFSRGSFVVFRL